MCTTAATERKDLEHVPLLLCDDHDDVVPFWVRGIGARVIEHGSLLIHWDAHPDLLLLGGENGNLGQPEVGMAGMLSLARRDADTCNWRGLQRPHSHDHLPLGIIVVHSLRI